jgi:hypothetical protein
MLSDIQQLECHWHDIFAHISSLKHPMVLGIVAL